MARPQSTATQRTIGEKLLGVQWPLLGLLCLLATVGITAQVAAGGGSFSPWADKHALRFVLTLALVLAIACTPLQWWIDIAYPVYAIALLLLMLVPYFGIEALGARRWLGIGGVTFQPAELMKVALVLMLARYYQALRPDRVSSPLYVLVPLVLIALPVALTLKQPDLGTAVLFGLVGVTLMYLAGVTVFYFIGGALAAVWAAPLVWSRLHDYQRRRVEIFLDPDKDPLGAGYHIAQSKIALGSGGLSGRGFMQGTQSQLDFIPEKHTDFIFATLAEQWGFAGAMTLVALYVLVLALMITMALRCRSQFARLAIGGAGLIVFLYAFINIAMVTGIVPVVGVPLPLISYGGTSMTTIMVAVGIAMCAHVNRTTPVHRGG